MPAKKASKAATKRAAKATKRANKAVDGEGGETKKDHSKKRHETYSTYIYRVLKQVHNDLGISNKAMNVMNSFIQDIFERIASEAALLCRINGTKTLTSKEIQTAVRLILPGELAKHGVSEGTKSVQKYKRIEGAGEV